MRGAETDWIQIEKSRGKQKSGEGGRRGSRREAEKGGTDGRNVDVDL